MPTNLPSRRTLMLLAAGLLLTVALAGCTAKGHDGTESSSTSTPPSTTTSQSATTGPPPPPPANASYPKQVHWSSCEGWFTGFTYPPGGKPPGAAQDPQWGQPQVNGGTSVVTRSRECARVSWGPFERPVRMIYETHDYIGPPSSCYPPQNATSSITQLNELASLWVNDSALADYLKQTYPGLPIYYSAIDTATTATGPVTQRTWKWGTSAGQSSLTVNDDGLRDGSNSVGRRLFWFSDGGVAYMDLVNDFATQAVTGRGASGTLYPPMLWGYNANPYASTGEWESASTMEGTIQLFHDHLCKQPV